MINQTDFPDDWLVKTLADVVVNAKNGGTPETSTDEYWDGCIEWLSSGEIFGKEVHSAEKRITERGLKESSAKMFPKDSVLVAMYGDGDTKGRSVINRSEMSGNQAICCLVPKEEILSEEYLLYYLKSIKHDLRELARGAGQDNLNQGLIIEQKIPIPPLDEQEQIVEVVEERLERVERLEKSVNNINILSQEYDESVILSLMSGGIETQALVPPESSNLPNEWDIVNIKDVAQVETGGTPKTSVDEYWGGDITWIRVSDMPEGMYVSESEDKITETGLREGSCSLIDEGGVVLSTRATIGKVAIADEEIATNQGFKSIIPESKLESEYLAYYLDSVTEYLESLGKGATYDEINKTQVQNIEIPLPPSEEQKRIVDRIESFDSEIIRVAVESVGDLFTEYRNSVLSHAFQGRIEC